MTAEDAENEIEFNRAPIYRLNWFLRIRKLNVDGKVSLPLNGIFSLSLIWWWWLKNNNRWFSLWERFQMRHNGLIIYGNRLLSMLKLFSILNLSIFFKLRSFKLLKHKHEAVVVHSSVVDGIVIFQKPIFKQISTDTLLKLNARVRSLL